MEEIGTLLETLSTGNWIYLWGTLAVATAGWIVYGSYREGLPSTRNPAIATVLAVCAIPALALALFPDAVQGFLPEESTLTRSFLLYLNPIAGMLSIVVALLHRREIGDLRGLGVDLPRPAPSERPTLPPAEVKRFCEHCGKLQRASWDICPYCSASEKAHGGAQQPKEVRPERPEPKPPPPIPGPRPIGTQPLPERPSAPDDTIELYGRSPAWVVFTGGARTGDVIRLSEFDNVIGRASRPDGGIQIDDKTVSADHARIARDLASGRWVIHDLGAENFVFVNGERVTQQTLDDGDRILLGRTEIGFMEVVGTNEG